MAKQPRVWDGTQWQELAVQVPDMSNYAYLPTTPVSGFRNKIINGGFDVWQRGTSFSSPATGTYTADRWRFGFDGSGATRTISQQAFTLGFAPVPGYEGRFFYRYAQTVAGSGATFNNFLEQSIENVRTFAGQTVTVSFWAKADTTRTIVPIFTQYFGTGGSPSSPVYSNGSNITLSTSWQRFSSTIALPSITGKTIGTNGNDSLTLTLQALSVNTTLTIDIWGVQVEPGSVATPFEQRPIGTELALCQRYFVRLNPSAANVGFARGYQWSATTGQIGVYLPVALRGTPTLAYSALTNFACLGGAGWVNPTSLSITGYSENMVDLTIGFSSGSIGRAQYLEALNTNAWLSFSSEL